MVSHVSQDTPSTRRVHLDDGEQTLLHQTSLKLEIVTFIKEIWDWVEDDLVTWLKMFCVFHKHVGITFDTLTISLTTRVFFDGSLFEHLVL